MTASAARASVLSRAALFLLRESALVGGHWITVSDGFGIGTHMYIANATKGSRKKGEVIAGPHQLIGANVAHLPPPDFTLTHHPAGHTPEGAESHPSYTATGDATHMTIGSTRDALRDAHAQSRATAARQQEDPEDRAEALRASRTAIGLMHDLGHITDAAKDTFDKWVKSGDIDPGDVKDLLKKVQDTGKDAAPPSERSRTAVDDVVATYKIDPGWARVIRDGYAQGLFTQDHVFDMLSNTYHTAKAASLRQAQADAARQEAEKIHGVAVGARDVLSARYFANPTYSIHIHGKEADSAEIAKVQDAFEAMSGKRASIEDIIALSGAPSGSRVEFGPSLGNNIAIQAMFPTLGTIQRRSIKPSPSGPIIENGSFEIEGAKRGGIGARCLALQVATARRLGIRSITLNAGGVGTKRLDRHEGDRYKDGYIVWPKLGYDRPLSEVELQEVPDSLNGARSVMALMASPEGRKYWEEYGSSGDMSFDMKDGSPSLAFHDAYNKARGIYVTPREE